MNYHSSVITIMVKNDNFLCVNCTIKTGTVREQVRNLLKRLLFFIKTGFFFLSKNSLQSRLRPRVYPSWRPGCGRGADPGLCETFTGVWGCLSAMLEVFLCPVFASFPAKKVVLYLNASVCRWLLFEHSSRFVAYSLIMVIFVP